MASHDQIELRRILGHYPTGVCAITAMAGDAPVGMIVGSFTSVSLDPALVAFFPDRRSTTWPRIEAAGRFCVNILSEHQEPVCRALATRGENKFDGIGFRPSPGGQPVLDGSVAWIDCAMYAVHEAGDHYIAVGEIGALAIEQPHGPLLFFKGRYGRLFEGDG